MVPLSPRRWTVDTTGTVAEILISGEGLHRDPRAVLGTLLHEAAHALAAARGIKETSRQHRYHNRSIQGPGRRTRPGRRPRRADRVVADQRPRLDRRNLRPVASQAPRRHDFVAACRTQGATGTGNTTGTGNGTRASSLIAAACPCGRSIRIAATTLAAAPVICGACGGGFTPKGPR